MSIYAPPPPHHHPSVLLTDRPYTQGFVYTIVKTSFYWKKSVEKSVDLTQAQVYSMGPAIFLPRGKLHMNAIPSGLTVELYEE